MTSLVDFKTFNMHVATPHEFFMALEPEIFGWESRIETDYNMLLPKLQKGKVVGTKNEIEEAKSQHLMNSDETSLSLV